MLPETVDRLIAASRPTNADIDAELSPATRAKILDDILDQPAQVVPLAPRRRRRLPLLIAAAAGLAAVGLGVQAILPNHVETTVVPLPRGGQTTVTTTKPPVGLPAASALEPVAQAAAAQAPTTPQGTQYLHVKQTTYDGTTAQYTRETFVAADGWTWRCDVVGREHQWSLYKATLTGIDVAKLPSDPAALDAALRAGSGTRSGDERVFKNAIDVLRSEWATPAVKAATIRVLDAMASKPRATHTTKGMTSTPVFTVAEGDNNGRPAVLVTFTDTVGSPGISSQLTLEKSTGNLLQISGTSGSSTWREAFETRELVGSLPADFTRTLGTARVEKNIVT